MWSEHSSIALGLFFACLSAFVSSSGLVMQKLSVQLNPAASSTRLSDSPLYVGGIFMVAISVGLKLVAYVILPYSSLSVISYLTLVFHELLHQLILNSERSHADMVSITAATTTATGILFVIFGSNLHPDTVQPMDQLWERMWGANGLSFALAGMTGLICFIDFGRRYFDVTVPPLGALFSCVAASSLLSAWSGLCWKVAAVAWTYHLFIVPSVAAAGVPLWLVSAASQGLNKLRSNYISAALEEFSNVRFRPAYQVSNLLLDVLFGIVVLGESSATYAKYENGAGTGTTAYFWLGVSLVAVGLALNRIEGGADNSNQYAPAMQRDFDDLPQYQQQTRSKATELISMQENALLAIAPRSSAAHRPIDSVDTV